MWVLMIRRLEGCIGGSVRVCGLWFCLAVRGSDQAFDQGFGMDWLRHGKSACVTWLGRVTLLWTFGLCSGMSPVVRGGGEGEGCCGYIEPKLLVDAIVSRVFICFYPTPYLIIPPLRSSYHTILSPFPKAYSPSRKPI